MATGTQKSLPALESLGLHLQTFDRLTQSGRYWAQSDRGIKTIGQLIRCEGGNLLCIWGFGHGSLLHVRRQLDVHGLRLAEYISGPCIPAPDDDTWVRLPDTSYEPSWLLRSELPTVTLNRLIDGSAAVFKSAGLITIGDVLALTQEQVLASVDWARKPHRDGPTIVQRLVESLYKLGLTLHR